MEDKEEVLSHKKAWEKYQQQRDRYMRNNQPRTRNRIQEMVIRGQGKFATDENPRIISTTKKSEK